MYIIYLHSHRHIIVENKQQSKNKNVAHIFSILLGFFSFTFVCLRFLCLVLDVACVSQLPILDCSSGFL
jgi:hypothetical protein